MFTASGWTDYEILDASGGEKLERWGEYLLVRPDPQVIWNTKRLDPGWKKANAIYHRSKSGGGEWEFRNLPKQWQISYRLGASDLTFHLKPFSFTVRVYRRRNHRRSLGRRGGDACGRLKGHDALGEGKCGLQRLGGRSREMAGG